MDSKSKQMQEGGDSSDSDVLENWTILDAEEAAEAISLDEKQADEEQDSEVSDSCPTGPVSEEVDAPKDDSVELEPLKSEEQKSEVFTEPCCDTDTDDGVSIITDSEPEELMLPAGYSAHQDSQARHRFSDHSNDYFDTSDTASLYELPESLGEPGDRKYVHRRNKKIDLLLNSIIVVFLASVIGLGVGHFLGVQEAGDVSAEVMSSNMLTLLRTLETENSALKLQLKQLQQGTEAKIFDSRSEIEGQGMVAETDAEPLWNMNGAVADPDHRTEAADVVGAAGLALAENLSKTSLDLNGATNIPAMQEPLVKDEVVVESSPPQQVEELTTAGMLEPAELTNIPEISDETQESKEDSNPKTTPLKYKKEMYYTDEELEAIQLRYARETPVHHSTHEVPTEEVKQSESNSGKKGKDETSYDSFFNNMEAELNGVMNRVIDYSSNFVKTNNVKDHVTKSINVLSSTLQDMQSKVKSLGETTAKHSIQAMDKVKKSVYKMVQNVKHTSENIMRIKPESGSMSHKVMKGISTLKDGLMNKWCHLKGKMAESLGGKEREVTKNCHLQYQAKESSSKPRGEKTKLHHSKSFKPRHEGHYDHEYNDQQHFNLKIKHNKNRTQPSDEHYKYKKYQKNEKYYKQQKFQMNPKMKGKQYKGKDRYEKRKNAYNNGRFDKQRRNERDWKEREARMKECGKKGHCNVSDGEWMKHLAEARERQRQSEQKSDWLFDRARSRKEWREEEHGKPRYKNSHYENHDYFVHQGYNNDPWVDSRKI